MVAKRSDPTSEVRGSDQECQAVTVQEQPRGATLLPRPGAVAKKSYPTFKIRAAARRSHTAPEDRGCGREEQPHVQGAVAAQVQEGLEELSHREGQKGWQ